MKIMDKFPESALLFQRPILVGVSTEKIEDLQQKVPQEQGAKIWQFSNPALGYELNVSGSSLNISSTSHKTYNNPLSDNRFRDIIAHVVNHSLV